jgi:carbon storage regulator CsrA
VRPWPAASLLDVLIREHQIDRSKAMQVFVQAKNEAVVINGEIFVTVVDILENEVLLAIDAPERVEVCTKETSTKMPVWPR